MSSKPAVLIVEDNKINALVLKKTIESICEPDHVICDEAVFRAVSERDYKIILMDINLGGNSLDGEAIMKILKEDDRYRHIPIFAVTSYAMPGDEERFLSAGFDRYYSKPIARQKIKGDLGLVLSTQVESNR
ncbi:MAG: response regulator [Bacteroidota bacterium]